MHISSLTTPETMATVAVLVGGVVRLMKRSGTGLSRVDHDRAHLGALRAAFDLGRGAP